MRESDYQQVRHRLQERLTSLPTTPPIPYRGQDGGDYDEHLLLRPEHATGQQGIHIHAAGNDPTACDRTGSTTEAAR